MAYHLASSNQYGVIGIESVELIIRYIMPASDLNKIKEDKTTLYAIFTIVAGTILVYATGLRGPFLLDDLPCIVLNPTIKNISLAFTTFGHPEAISDGSFTYFNYRPLMPVIYAFVHALFGLAPFAYHLLNILVHALNGVLIYFLILRVTRHAPASFAAAAWWALHPVHVESVQNASGTDDLLNATFTVLALLLLLKKRTGWSLFLFALALLTKESAVVAPGLIFIMMFREKEGAVGQKLKQAFLVTVPFAILAIGYMSVRYFFQGLEHGNAPVQNITESLIIFPKIFLVYMRLMLVPAGLRINYFIPVVTQVGATVIFGYAIITGMLLAALICLKKKPLISLGIAWFFIAFIPVSNLVPIRTLVGERFMYLPFVGAAIIIGVVGSGIRSKKIFFAGAWAILLVVLAVGSMIRIGVWCDEEKFWKDIIHKEPGFRVYQMYETNLALFYMKHQRPDEAEALFKEALRQQPGNKKFAANLAQFFYLTGKYKPAGQLFEQLVKEDPKNPAFAAGLELAKAALEKNGASAKNIEEE